jgi:hypothetical protein
MDISLFLTILFGIVSVVAFLYAMNESKKAKRAEIKILEIEKAVTSYKYLKDKASEYYLAGRYDDCLDVYKKYFLDNKDENELISVILEIYKRETNVQLWNRLKNQDSIGAVISIIYYIMNDEKFINSPQYPELIKKLIEMYHKNFKKEIIPVELMISIFDKDWRNAKMLISKMNAFNDSEMNKYFQDLVIKYCSIKIGTTDDHFTDDIPF